MQLLSRSTRLLQQALNNCRSRSTANSIQMQQKKLISFLRQQPNLKYNCNSKFDGLRFSTFRTTPFASPKTVQKFHATDGVSPKTYTLIYKTNFQRYLLATQTVVFLSVGAVLTVIIGIGLQSQLPAEERALLVLEKQKKLAAEQKQQKQNFQKDFNVEVDENPEHVENVPGLSDTVAHDLEQVLVLLGALVILSVSMFKLMTMLPLRIYVGKKHHCVGMSYGSLIPGRLTRQEFVAGTLKRHKSVFGKADITFKDGSGRSMVLLQQFFRRPSDFDYLIGIKKSFDVDDEDSDDGAMSHLKQIGSFGTETKTKEP